MNTIRSAGDLSGRVGGKAGVWLGAGWVTCGNNRPLFYYCMNVHARSVLGVCDHGRRNAKLWMPREEAGGGT